MNDPELYLLVTRITGEFFFSLVRISELPSGV